MSNLVHEVKRIARALFQPYGILTKAFAYLVERCALRLGHCGEGASRLVWDTLARKTIDVCDRHEACVVQHVGARPAHQVKHSVCHQPGIALDQLVTMGDLRQRFLYSQGGIGGDAGKLWNAARLVDLCVQGAANNTRLRRH